MRTIIALALTIVAATTLAEERVSCAYCNKQVIVARDLWNCLLLTARSRFEADDSDLIVLVKTKDECAALEVTQNTQFEPSDPTIFFAMQHDPDIGIPFNPKPYIDPNLESESPWKQEDGKIAFNFLLVRTQLKCLVEESELNTSQGDMIVFDFSSCPTEGEG
jgi:hypothetical protein